MERCANTSVDKNIACGRYATLPALHALQWKVKANQTKPPQDNTLGLWKKEQRSCWWIKVFGCGLADNKRITLVCSCWREVHVPPHMPPSAKLDNINPVHCVLFGCCHLLLASMPIVWSHWLSICTFYVNDIFMCYIMYLSWFIHNFSSWKGLGYYLWNHVHKPLSTSDIYF